MKKFVFLVFTFLLLISSNVSAWEATFDLGYYGRLFNQKDELGATRPKQDTKFNFTNGLALNGNLLFGAKSFSFGPELSFNYGLTDTRSLQTQAVALSLATQYNYGPLNFGAKAGVVSNILTEDFMDKLDADTGFIFGFKGSADIFEGQQFFFEPQLFLSPSTMSEGSFIPSFAFVIGVQKRIKPTQPVVEKPKVEQPKPVEKPFVVPPAPVVLPKEPTPVVVEEKKPEPIKPPEPVKLPEPAKPILPEIPKPLTLNFNGNEVDPASTLLEAVLKAYNSKPSVIVIAHKKESKKRANSVAEHFKKNGVKPEDIQLKPGPYENSIKISVRNKGG